MPNPSEHDREDAEDAAHQYGYGEQPWHAPASHESAPKPGDPQSPGGGGVGPDGADGANTDSGAGTGTGSAADGTTDPTSPVTGVQPTHTRSAVVREVPEGFAPPPPDAARRTRPDAREEDSAPRGPRPLVVVGIALGALLLAGLIALGGFFGVRALLDGHSTEASSPAGSPSTSEDGTTVAVGDVHVSLVDAQQGVTQIGSPTNPTKPKNGQFVVVTVKVTNDTKAALSWDSPLELIDAQGKRHPADRNASTQWEGKSKPSAIIAPGDTATLHTVFDVPDTSTYDKVEVDLKDASDAGTGTLDLSD